MQIGQKTLIAVDLDGTLLNDKKEISNYTKRIFYILEKKGAIITIITARNYKRTVKYLNQIYGQYAICTNGASIWNRLGECLYRNFIDIQLYHKLLNKIYRCFFDIEIKIVMSNKTITISSYHESLCCIDGNIEGILISEHIKEVLTLIQDENCQKRVLENSLLLITSYSSTKLLSLKYLLNITQIPKEYTIAFGDDINDMEILEYCFESIVPANGNQQIMNLATDICNDNNSDGVASWLSKRFNIERED